MSESLAAASDICAVIVTYFPQPECAENLVALAPQVAHILIVDNGSSAESLAPIEAAASGLGATVLRLGQNLGIAAALNAGLAFAHERGYRWLGTFDQDSRATTTMIARMIETLQSYPQAERVAVVAPVQREHELDIGYAGLHTLVAGRDWRLLAMAMTSGNLVNVAAAMAAGGFDATLFIDYVDHEFCFRLRRRGRQILEASNAILIHSLGKMEVRKFLWKRPRISHHPPVRRYYITRNRVIVWRQNWRFDWGWTWRDVRNFLYEIAYIVLWEKQVPAKLWMMVRGICDGLRDVRGPIDARAMPQRAEAP